MRDVQAGNVVLKCGWGPKKQRAPSHHKTRQWWATEFDHDLWTAEGLGQRRAFQKEWKKTLWMQLLWCAFLTRPDLDFWRRSTDVRCLMVGKVRQDSAPVVPGIVTRIHTWGMEMRLARLFSCNQWIVFCVASNREETRVSRFGGCSIQGGVYESNSDERVTTANWKAGRQLLCGLRGGKISRRKSCVLVSFGWTQYPSTIVRIKSGPSRGVDGEMGGSGGTRLQAGQGLGVLKGLYRTFVSRQRGSREDGFQ